MSYIDNEKILMDIYQDLYQNATPTVDFKELVDNAEINEMGQKVIPFDDYEIDDDKMIKIIEKHLDKNGVPNYQYEAFKNTILLGCSPKSKS